MSIIEESTFILRRQLHDPNFFKIVVVFNTTSADIITKSDDDLLKILQFWKYWGLRNGLLKMNVLYCLFVLFFQISWIATKQTCSFLTETPLKSINIWKRNLFLMSRLWMRSDFCKVWQYGLLTDGAYPQLQTQRFSFKYGNLIWSFWVRLADLDVFWGKFSFRLQSL